PEDVAQLVHQVGLARKPAPVVVAVLGRLERPERDLAAEELRQPRRRARVVGGHRRTVGKRDLHGRHVALAGLAQIPRRAAHQTGQLLTAADLAGCLVAQRPAAVAGHSVGRDGRLRELLADHRLHRVAPELLYRTDLRHREPCSIVTVAWSSTTPGLAAGGRRW